MQFIHNNRSWISIIGVLVVLWFGLLYYVAFVQEEVSPQKASLFVLNTYDGRVIGTEEFLGQPVVLNFWAAWCTFCRKEMPILESLQHKYADEGLIVIGVHRSETESRESGLDFVENEVQVTYTLVSDRNNNIFNYFGRGSHMVPLTVFIDREGFITNTLVGARSELGFERFIKEIL